MPLASARRPVLALAVTALIVAVATGCVFDRGPLITCADVATDDCDQALEMARPLMHTYWEQASQVYVHAGGCVRSRICPATLAQDPGFITVDLVSDQPESASVVFDRRNAEWTARCFLTPTPHGYETVLGHGRSAGISVHRSFRYTAPSGHKHIPVQTGVQSAFGGASSNGRASAQPPPS
jgi:hypothetical protein